MNDLIPPLGQLDRFLIWFAATIAALITLLPTCGYLAFAWHETGLYLEHQSRIQATAVTRFISRNPDVWSETHERLLASLTGLTLPHQHTLVVIDSTKRTIGEIGLVPTHALVLGREARFFEFGIPVGVVRVEASMEDPLKMAGFIFLVSGILGALVFGPMRRIPLAALSDSVRQLERSEERFRRLTEMSSDWYWAQDTEHRYTFISRGAQRSGKDVAKSIGKARWDHGIGIAPEVWADHRCLLDARKPFQDFKYAIRSIDGDERWISVSGEPTYDAQGRFSGYHGTARDETLRNRAEDIIRNQQELLSEMVERRTADLQAALARSQQIQKDMERAAHDSK